MNWQTRWGVGALFLAVLVSGCSCEPVRDPAPSYACSQSKDCLEGHQCIDGVCQPGTTGGGTGGGATGGGAQQGGGTTGGGGGVVSCADRIEVCGDDIDDNCNGVLDDGCDCAVDRGCYPDVSGLFGPRLESPQLRYGWDGGVGCAAGTQRCMNGKFAQTCLDVHVPANEVCDGKDNDCDGVTDLPSCPCQNGRECFPGAPNTNGIGVCHSGTFNCSMPASSQCVGVNIGGVEVCNGLDDDCNGAVDDSVSATSACAPGVCSSQFKTCGDAGEVACVLTSIPGYSVTEVCGDQLDNNCDGFVDDGCTCDAGAMQGCYTGPATACDGGSCYGVCRRGAQTCGVASDGGVGFGGCMNEVLPSAELCSDLVDNDCDNAVDCADSQCNNRACGGGKTCAGATCQCVAPDGGLNPVEICNDTIDNNCNAMADCAEASCSGQVCGTNGKRCVGTSCTCVVDGGVAQMAEATCSDQLDNDCDGLVDCADTTCAGQSCGTNKSCIQNVCTCLSDGGVPQSSETLCSDGVDNDCDGVTDCADPNCAASCATAENCKDGIDNDGDSLIDCADTDCQHKGCSASSASSFCCGVTCKNLGTDAFNCGQCGAICASGVCQASTSSGHASGRCTCPTGMAAQCPMTGPTRQQCTANVCTCGDDNDRCSRAEGGQCAVTTCYYP